MMKIPKGLSKMIEEAFQEHFSVEETEMQTIGLLSPGLLDAFQQNHNEQEKAAGQAERILNKARRQVEAMKDELEERHDLLWEKVYAEFNLKDHGNYSIDHSTGVLSKKVPKILEE